MRRVLILLGALALAALDSGCTKTSCNDRDPDLIEVYRDDDSDAPPGATLGITEGNTFYSGSSDGPYLHFPPARTYVFKHDLGPNPWWFSYVAFSKQGNLALAAGDMAVSHKDETDPESSARLSILNNTCSEFFLWQVITVPASSAAPEPAGAAGAAGDDGQAGAAGTAGE